MTSSPRPAKPGRSATNARASESALPDPLAAARAQIVALATELDTARRDLWIERARRAFPALRDEAVELITAADEAGVLRQAALLVAL